MDYQILLDLLLLAGLVYYFRQAFASQKNKARIVDLLVVGIILFASPKIHVPVRTDPPNDCRNIGICLRMGNLNY